MKIALIHDWFYHVAGAEKVFSNILQLYPDADIYCLFEKVSSKEKQLLFNNKKIHTTFLQYIPFIEKMYKILLPIFPYAISTLDVSKYDLIISSSHAVAKGVKTNKNQIHICYCHTPMRYVWDLKNQYLKSYNFLLKYAMNAILNKMKKWDYKISQNVDYYIANSHFIAKRIKKNYHRESIIIEPSIDISKFEIADTKEDYYITTSRFVYYKRLDIIIETFQKITDKNLVIIGSGDEFNAFKNRTKNNANIKLLGSIEEVLLIETLKKAKAFIFAAEEDFGIAPIEAQACGIPVIGFGKGGLLETIIGKFSNEEITDNKQTGIFFKEQTVDSIIESILFFEKNIHKFDPEIIRENAIRFDKKIFESKFKAAVEEIIMNHK